MSHPCYAPLLGLQIDSSTNSTWAVTQASAEARICQIMNDSVVEVDMFRLLVSRDWPEPFWIAQLERYMSGK